MSFTDEERAKLIAALTKYTVLVADTLLEACRHLTAALEWRRRQVKNRLPRLVKALSAGVRIWTS